MRWVPRRLGLAFLILSIISAFTVMSGPAQAQSTDRASYSGLPVPRFVALKKDKVFGRMMPDEDVAVVYRRKNLPVMVIAESPDNRWRRIEDHTGRRVWISRSMLQESRHALTTAPGILFSEPTDTALPRARVEPGVLATLETCDGQWCRIKTGSYRGWTERQNLWGAL